MKITIDLEKLHKLSITPNQYVFLYHLVQNKSYPLLADDLQLLQNKGFIKIDSESNIIIRAKTKNIFVTEVKVESDIKTLVEKYRDLFPSGVKTYGYLVKGDLQGCIKKMTKFKQTYDYTDTEILEATQAYVLSKKKHNYNGMQLAHFFIEKEGISNLAGMCEDIRLNGLKLDSSNETGNVEVM